MRMRFASASSAAWDGKREIIRGAMPQASASTPMRAEREIIRDKTRASTVVGQARWGCEPWVIIRGEGTRASAARWRCGRKASGRGVAAGKRERWSSGSSSVDSWCCQGTRGREKRTGGGACRWPCGPIPLGCDVCWLGCCDSWDSLILS